MTTDCLTEAGAGLAAGVAGAAGEAGAAGVAGAAGFAGTGLAGLQSGWSMPEPTMQAPWLSFTGAPCESVTLGVTLANAEPEARATIAPPSVSFPSEKIFIFGTPKRIWMIVVPLSAAFCWRLSPKTACNIIHKGPPVSKDESG